MRDRKPSGISNEGQETYKARCNGYLRYVTYSDAPRLTIKDILVVSEYPYVFPEELLWLLSKGKEALR